MTPPSRALRTKAGLNHGVQAMPSSVRSCLGWPLPCVFHGHGYSPFVTMVPVTRAPRGLDEARFGRCFDAHHSWRVPVVVTLPVTRACVLRGEVGPVGAISSDIGYCDVFVAQEVVRLPWPRVGRKESTMKCSAFHARGRVFFFALCAMLIVP